MASEIEFLGLSAEGTEKVADEWLSRRTDVKVSIGRSFNRGLAD